MTRDLIKTKLQQFLDYQLLILQFDVVKFYLKLKCRLGKHYMSDWHVPMEMKEHYMASCTWRYCLRKCGSQQTKYEFEEDV